MADNDNPSREDGEWPRPPYAWIITPLLIFAAIAVAAIIIGVRRRRAGRRIAALPSRAQRPPSNGRQPATDLEAGRGAGRGRRWGGLRRREEGVEGLNEEGEAPPPYQAAGKKADVELEEVERVRERLPGYGEEGTGAGAGAVRAPPAAVTRE